MAKLGRSEKSLLQFLNGGAAERHLFNDVVLTKAIQDGYAERYGMTMIRITEAGISRLEQLQDQGR